MATLDPLGNRLGDGYSYNLNNQLLESPLWFFSYDLDGNLIKKSHKTKDVVYTYSWDNFGKLSGLLIEKNGELYRELGFKYDGAGRRVEKLFVDYKNASESYVKRYVYDGQNIIMELDGQNQMKAVFVNGEGIDDPRMMIRDEDGNTYFEQDEAYAYTKDHLGSIREIVDHKGEVRQRYSYSSYGETKIAKIGNGEKLIDSPFGFTGREIDLESGDYYYRARYYDSQTGRFISEDPIGFRGGDTSLYRYVGNDPVNKIDPNGKSAFLIAGAAVLSYELGFSAGTVLSGLFIEKLGFKGTAKALVHRSPIIRPFVNYAGNLLGPFSTVFDFLSNPDSAKVIKDRLNRTREKQLDQLINDEESVCK